MDKSVDFDLVARWYDTYVTATFDEAFWLEQARRHPGKRLELMCGTGRLSLPILRAGLDLTCVDYSAGLLAVFREKLARAGLTAETFERDVRDLRLAGFDYVFIGFHSFSELVTRADQLSALRSIHDALRPGGSFVLSLHNPPVRGPQMDGQWRDSGPVALSGGGRLELRGRYLLDATEGIVEGVQRYREFDVEGALVEELELPMRFRLPGRPELEALFAATGFAPNTWWGDYQWSAYSFERSPFLICEATRTEQDETRRR